jgi:hypothetical protein
VKALERDRYLVLGDEVNGLAWAWSFVLVPIDDRRTRLVTRSIARPPRGVGGAVATWVLDVAALLMTRQMLINLKRRAEALPA